VRTQSLPAKLRGSRPLQSAASSATTRASHAASSSEAYRLSRIQADGWNAAHRIGASALDKLDEMQIESLNPYASDPERVRWHAGFASALVY
jgi:hypothetical protein